jgi:hypothetical protein
VGLVALSFAWPSFVRHYQAGHARAWTETYGSSVAEIWQSVHERMKPGTTVAYTNTFLVHPLFGPNFGHRLLHVPVSSSGNTLAEIRPIERPVSGEQLIPHVVRSMVRDANEHAWLDRLNASGAEVLVVMRNQSNIGLLDEPIELTWARTRFPILGSSAVGEVFKVTTRGADGALIK